MRRILILLLSVLLVAALAAPAFAADTTNLVILLEEDGRTLPGAEFEVFRVGEAAVDGTLKLTGTFARYPVELKNAGEDTSAQAAALYGFAKKDGLNPDAVAITNSHGTALVTALPSGLYLVAGRPLVSGGFLYHTEPQLILLPQADPVTGEILKNPVLRVKFSKDPYTPTPVSRKVLKIWDDVSGHIRPASVKVHLLKNGTVFHTVTLTAQNQWRHTWENLEPDALWQIAEEVPAGYSVTVEQDGTTFLLTNSAPEAPPPPTTPPATPPSTGGKIPQTGMLWWPVALLAGLGVLFLAAGSVSRKKMLKLLGVLLLAAGLWMVAGNLRQQEAAEETSREVLNRLELPQRDQSSPEMPVLTQVPDYQRNPHMEMPEEVLDGTAYIGTLEIPDLDLALPVVSTTTGENLQKAPCRYSGSAYTDDLVLGAHNYDAHFGRLKKLSYGDAVRVTDLDGNVFSYQVADIEILQPDQLEDLLGGGWPLTLYTCTPGGQSRVTIRCERS